MAEIARDTSESQDQIVVVQQAFAQRDLLCAQIDIDHLFHQYRQIRMIRKNGPNRLGNFRRGESRRGDLVEKRLKQVVVRAINERDSRLGMAQMLAKCKPAEPRS